MAELGRPGAKTSQDCRARVPRWAFDAAEVDPSPMECVSEVGQMYVEVKISPGAMTYLETLDEDKQDRQLVRALCYAEANSEDLRTGVPVSGTRISPWPPAHARRRTSRHGALRTAWIATDR